MAGELTNWIAIHWEYVMLGVTIFVSFIFWVVCTKIYRAFKAKREWRKRYKDFDYNYTESDKLNKKVFGDML